MKNRFAIAMLLLLSIIVTLFFPGCDRDDPPTKQEQIVEKLTSAEAWQSPTVTIDGVDYSDLYKDLQINFTKDTYTSSGGAPVWAPSGTWAFLNKESNLMLLDGVTEVSINSISNDLLELTLYWSKDTFDPGRKRSVKGNHKYVLKKK
jgi:hypothetical protein